MKSVTAESTSNLRPQSELPRLAIGHLCALLDRQGRVADSPADLYLAAANRVLAATADDVRARIGEVVARSGSGHLLHMEKVDGDYDVIAALIIRGAFVAMVDAAITGPVATAPAPTVSRLSSDDGAIGRLLALAEALGVPVRWATIGNARGRCSATGIDVDPGAPDLARLLGHEIAHALDFRHGLLPVDVSRQHRECLADELGAMLVALGVSTAAQAERIALDYVRSAPMPDDGGLAVDTRLLQWWPTNDFSGWSP